MPSATDAFRNNAIYLTRAGLAAGLRRASAEAVLEEQVGRLGMMVVRPEALTLADQVSLFNTASFVAGTVGSAFHTQLFSLRGDSLKMLIFSWEKLNSRYPMIDQIIGSSVKYVNASTIRSLNEHERVVDIDLDVGRSISALEYYLR